MTWDLSLIVGMATFVVVAVVFVVFFFWLDKRWPK